MPTKKPKAKTLKPLTRPPAPPASLKTKKHALAYWKRISKLLVESQTITSQDLEALEALCREWQRYVELSEWIDANPEKEIVEYESGHVNEHPKVRLRQIAFVNLLKLWPKFGLHPKGAVDINKKGSGAEKLVGAAIAGFASKKKGKRYQ